VASKLASLLEFVTDVRSGKCAGGFTSTDSMSSFNGGVMVDTHGLFAEICW
jgi:hypothetical protein